MNVFTNGIWIKTTDLANLNLIKKYFTIRTLLIADKYVVNIQYQLKLNYNSCKTGIIFRQGEISGASGAKMTSYIIIPRFGLLELLQDKQKLQIMGLSNKNIYNKISSTDSHQRSIHWIGELKNNQPLVFNTILATYFSEARVKLGMAGVILNLEAGQGKTFVAMALINKLQLKTLVVCHSESVLYDWTKELTKLFPNNTIGFQYGKKKCDGDIVISIVNSLLQSDLPNDFFKQFGFVIYDEVHMYCSQGLSCVFKRAQATYMLGLSATPNERNDKFDRVAWWNVGPVLDARTLPGYTETDIPFKGKVKMVQYMGPDEYTQHLTNAKTGLTDVVSMLSNLILDPYRLTYICEEVIQLLQNNNHNIFVFADRKCYLESINKKLHEMYENITTVTLSECSSTEEKGAAPPILDSIQITGGAKNSEMKYAETNANIILTTYQFMSVGKSIPKMNAIVLATPRKTHSRQIINRIFRLGANYSIERQIVDIVDAKTIFKKQWSKRKSYYVEKSYPIEKIIINAPDHAKYKSNVPDKSNAVPTEI